MANCDEILREYLREIEPTETQKTGAKRSHKYLRDILCTGQMARRIRAHYLSGSYARDTAIYPLDDVDVIFIVDHAEWSHGIFGRLSWPSPDVVLKSFAHAIRYRYRESSVYTQRRSVRLELNHLDIDVVPAVQDERDSDFIWVPDRDSDDWIKSSPKRHAKNATAVNKKRRNQFKPLVKLLKYWNGGLPSTANLKSFAIETIAVRLFSDVPFSTLGDGLLCFLDFVANFQGEATVVEWASDYGMSMNWLGSSIPDAAGTGSNIVAGVDGSRRDKFVKQAIRSRDRLLDAMSARTIEGAERYLAKALR